MAYSIPKKTKNGKPFFELRAYHSEKGRYYSKRWYPPTGWSKRAIEKALENETVLFQQKVDAGEVLTKEEARENAAAKKAAEDAAAAREAAEVSKLKTVKQYAVSIFMPKKEQSIAENTRLSYWSNLNEHIFPALGDHLIKDVNTAMINAMLLEFRKTHSYGSTIKVYNICNGLFGMAFRDDTIDINPMFKVERPEQKKDEKALSEADKALFENELLYVLECVKSEPLKWQAFIHLAADTGARRGELCGLQWSDIDLKNATVTIRRNLQYSKRKKVIDSDKTMTVVYDGVYYVTPKGGKSRTVDIGDDTIAILEAYKESMTSESRKGAEKSESDIDINKYRQTEEDAEQKLPKWIFTNGDKDIPMFPHTPTRYFKQFGERYNIPGFHPHLLRHTSATLSLTNGGDAKSVADRLGHADTAVLLRVYAHANDASIRKAGQAVRDALKKQKDLQKKRADA